MYDLYSSSAVRCQELAIDEAARLYKAGGGSKKRGRAV